MLREQWSSKDRALAQALVRYERGLCRGCGHPSSATHNVHFAGNFPARRSICQACEAIERAQGQQKNPPAGQKVFAVDLRNEI